MKITRVGLDLAKQGIAIHAVDRDERKVFAGTRSREQLLRWFTESVPMGSLVGMEACGGAHEWARRLGALGYRVRLMAPQHVKPYVKGQKNDANDAAAICEAVSRPTMRFVPVKTVEQQDAQAVHRVRALVMKARTAKGNEIRGLLAEYGVVVPKGAAALRKALPRIQEDAENGLTAGFRALLQGLYDDLVALDGRIDELDRQIKAHVRGHAHARRLMTIPGIGVVSASALVASIGDGRAFRNGRHLAAFLGLTPRQNSTGGKTRLYGIHKGGDTYLRKLLVDGARAVQRVVAAKTDPHSQWLIALSQRRHTNIATVAQANKTARIVWAVLTRNEPYRPQSAVA
jgi:transposase